MAPPGYSAARGTSDYFEKLVVMTDDRLQRRADRLAARVEALARALRASGASEEASARLLSQASAAALQALRLELLVQQS
jgi:ABC-type nitrate/sulfonate/bicarbonate transport system substrate-binding protein